MVRPLASTNPKYNMPKSRVKVIHGLSSIMDIYLKSKTIVMRTIYTLFAVMLLSATVQSQTCNNYWVQVSPDGNTLYFSSDRHGGDYEIYRSDIDGNSNLQRLTIMSGNDLHPSISPDGSKIVFQNGGYDSSAEIYIMNNDGSNLVQLTNNSVYDGSPSFSPNGQKIVFTAWDGSQYPEIFTMNVDGSNRTQLTNVAGAYWQSAGVFNPAGDKIYFLEGFNADNHIVMMDTDGSNWVDITPPNSFGYSEANISFSPDGSKIIFFTTENQGYNNGGDLVVADADGSNWSFLTNSTNGDYYNQACFHPINNELYYSFLPVNGSFEIHRMDTMGNNSVQLSTCSAVGIGDRTPIKGLEIFPNPASDVFYLTLEEKETANMLVYSALGQVTHEETLPAGIGSTQVDTSTWPAGIYLVTIQTPKAKSTQKLIINH